MLTGHQTWIFHNKPRIIETGTVGGPFEAQGNIPYAFDILHEDMWINQDSFEKAHQVLMEQACQVAIKKVLLRKNRSIFL